MRLLIDISSWFPQPARNQGNLSGLGAMLLFYFFWTFYFVSGYSQLAICDSFRWTAKGFSHTYIHAPILPQSGNVTVDQVNFKWIRLWQRRLLPNQKGMQIIYLQSFPFAQSELWLRSLSLMRAFCHSKSGAGQRCKYFIGNKRLKKNVKRISRSYINFFFFFFKSR